MKNFIFLASSACLLSIALCTTPAHAQQRYASPTYYAPTYDATSPTSYQTPTYYYRVGSATVNVVRPINSEFVADISNAPPAEPKSEATIRLLVPDPNAEVAFNGDTTHEMGTDRVFTSPPLDPARTYRYTVKATWKENGTEMTRSVDVRVQGGHVTMVNFGQPQEMPILSEPPSETMPHDPLEMPNGPG